MAAMVILVAASWITLATTARACSCTPPLGRFLVAGGTVLARDALGVPWWGPNATTAMRPVKEWFRVRRIGHRGSGEVEFDLITLPGSAVQGNESAVRDYVVLIAPRGGLVAGARYRFEVGRARDGSGDATKAGPDVRHPSGAPLGEARVEVRVSRERLAIGDRAARLRASKARSQPEDVPHASSCERTIVVCGAEVRLVLPSDLDRWRGALLYIRRSSMECRGGWNRICVDSCRRERIGSADRARIGSSSSSGRRPTHLRG